MNIAVINLLDMIELRGEDYVKKCLSVFECKKNSEIEEFLKKDALDFSKRGLSVTYVVYGEIEGINHLLGYFCLTYKIIQVKQDLISNTTARKIRTCAEYDYTTHTYTVPAPLIAQFGKNSGLSKEIYNQFKGRDLMSLALEQILRIQHLIGGRTVCLECEDNPFLLKFYESEGFKQYDKRYIDENPNIGYYCQLIKTT